MAAVVVVVIMFVVGYAFVTGLAMDFVKKAQQKLNTFDVVEPPPPPPPDVPPPPPPPDVPHVPPPPQVVTPPPIVPPPVVNSPPMATTTVIQQPPPAPPQPAPPKAVVGPPSTPAISQAAQSKGDPHGWYSADDYPASAIRAEAQGRVSIRLTVGTDGRVSACTVSSSSGNADLDNTTCRIAQRRGRYTPAKDAAGNPVSSTANVSISWVLPKD